MFNNGLLLYGFGAGPGAPITGSGTANTVALFTGTATLGNSVITQNAAATLVTIAAAMSITTGGLARLTVNAATSSGTTNSFLFSPPTHTASTASSEVNNYVFTGGSRQWATGALATQRNTWFTSPTISFVAASTVTNAYTVYIDAPTAGTNATITNNYALGVNGKLYVAGVINMGDANDNLYIGRSSGLLTTVDGFANTSVGVYSQLSVTTGDNNTTLGYQALYSNQVGDNNIAIGYGSLYTNTASDNIAIGYQALYSNSSAIYGIAIGNYALQDHSTGNRCIAIGHQSQTDETSGAANITIGYRTMFVSNGASNNLGIGDLALTAVTTGSQLVGLGGGALAATTSGTYHVAVGYSALAASTTVDFSTAIGGLSLTAATGANNTALGYSSGRTLTTGSSNVFLGYLAGHHASQKVDAVNSIAIGANTYTTLSNTIVLGDTSITAVGIGTFAPTANLHIVQQVQATGTVKGFIYTGAINTNQTASTEINGALWTTAGREWATGAITEQNEFKITSPTYSFVGASTITDASTLRVSAPTAGTNATLTRANSLFLTHATTASTYLKVYESATTALTIETGTNMNITAVAGQVAMVLYGTTRYTFNINQALFTPVGTTNSVTNTFKFDVPANTTQTASAERFGINVTNAGRQWNTGAITTQREYLFASPAYSFVGASTITNAYSVYAIAPTASTNATITSSWAIGCEGGFALIGSTEGFYIRGNGTTMSWNRNPNSGTMSATASGYDFLHTGNASQASDTFKFRIFDSSGVAVATAVTWNGYGEVIFAQAASTGRTASTEAIGWTFTSPTRQYATGALTTQREYVISAPTYAFVGASTITTAATMAIAGAPVAGTNATITNSLAFWVQAGISRFDGRVLEAQGADVASANNLALGTDGNAFEITGTTQINLISNLQWQNGSVVTLLFTSTPTVKHAQATTGTDVTILLAGAADFVASAGDTLTLRLSEIGGTQAWREIGRAVI